ncbi:MAG: STAS domain-containing protein [Rhodopirellula sp.]|nr:STAS domain-containing protein [Rhodopirellula sp.]
MHISKVSDDGDLVRLKVQGRIVHEGVTKSADPISQTLGADCYPRRVLMDLSGTEYIGSSGLSWVVVAHKRFRSAGGRLILHSAPPVVSDVIKIMRLELVLDVAESEREALEMAGGEST